ncbi:MAG: Smr/MutS family protein, partial [Flavobacteriales bacterium]
DLHYHVLTGVRDSASPHEMLSLQMEHFDRMMRRAEEKRIPRIVFIHGVGQGRLRQEIRDALSSYWPQCTCREGDPRKYGHGATEVRFKGG